MREKWGEAAEVLVLLTACCKGIHRIVLLLCDKFIDIHWLSKKTCMLPCLWYHQIKNVCCVCQRSHTVLNSSEEIGERTEVRKKIAALQKFELLLLNELTNGMLKGEITNNSKKKKKHSMFWN
jgi:hypothetical protein